MVVIIVVLLAYDCICPNKTVMILWLKGGPDTFKMASPKAAFCHSEPSPVIGVAVDRSLASCYFIRQKLEDDLTLNISLALHFQTVEDSSRKQQVAHEPRHLDSELDCKRGEDGKLLESFSSIGVLMR